MTHTIRMTKNITTPNKTNKQKKHPENTQFWSEPATTIQNATPTLEKRLTVSNKVKHSLATTLSNPTSRYLLKNNDHLCSQKNLHIYICSSFIHNHQKL